MLQQPCLSKVLQRDQRMITRISHRKALLSRGSENWKEISSEGKNIKWKKSTMLLQKSELTNEISFV